MQLDYSIESLLAKRLSGERVKYLFFWGHTPKKKGEVSSECLSQWYEAEFTIDDIVYLTAEHYMMAEKARLFNDIKSLEKILKCKHPGEAKSLGREVRNFDLEKWNRHRESIVFQGSLAKFSQQPVLKQFLINTNDRVLVEASPVDNIWGVGLAHNNLGIEDPKNWRGLNLLGFILMQVRNNISQETTNL